MSSGKIFQRAARSLSALAGDRVASVSRFAHVPKGPEDAILGVTLAYNADKNPQKINLGVGAYRDDAGLPFVLSAVREAERRMMESNAPMEYLPVVGSQNFIDKAVRLAYGESNPYVQDGSYAAIQTLSGTGACRMSAAFLSRFLNSADPAKENEKPLVLLPNPTWANHKNIFRDGGCDIGTYTYYDPATKSLDLDGCLASLSAAPAGSIVLLHACAHNPTGVDPSLEQWKEISSVMKAKDLFPLFDMAYQGFTSGDIDVDAASLRHFVDDGHRIILAQSFSKNFGLYGHRVGCLSILTDSAKEAAALNSQLKIIARPMYSNPPIHGVRIVEGVLGDPELERSWREEMRGMAERIISVRATLKNELETLGSKHNWDHIVNQHGMFCYSGLSPEQVARLSKEFSVYLTANGRISMAGVTSRNAAILANAIHEVTK